MSYYGIGMHSTLTNCIEYPYIHEYPTSTFYMPNTTTVVGNYINNYCYKYYDL